jgi:hypothetical protein
VRRPLGGLKSAADSSLPHSWLIYLVYDPHYHKASGCCVSEQFAGYVTIGGHHDRVAAPRADAVEDYERLARRAPVRFDALANEPAAALERLVTHRRGQSSVDASQVHYTILKAPAPIASWRSRVNVNGVVTPSPVGVAML